MMGRPGGSRHYGSMYERRGLPPFLMGTSEAGQIEPDKDGAIVVTNGAGEESIDFILPGDVPSLPAGPPRGAGTRNSAEGLEIIEADGQFWARNPMMGDQLQFIYQIVSGDYLAKLAGDFYGSQAEWRRIWNVPQNKAWMPDPDRAVYPGDRVLIPDLNEPLVGVPAKAKVTPTPPEGENGEEKKEFWTSGRAAVAAGVGVLAIGGTAYLLTRKKGR